MYWLLSTENQRAVRDAVDETVFLLSTIKTKVPHSDQLFPFQGRKVIEQAQAIIGTLSPQEGVVADPFMGSGSFVYAASFENRDVLGNEWEPYTFRMASSAYELDNSNYGEVCQIYITAALEHFSNYYDTVCDCGTTVMADSFFFDRIPSERINVKQHERLGPNGETIAYRQKKYRCPTCRRKNKFFTEDDQNKLDRIETEADPEIFNYTLIQNSRINLTGEFTQYANLFPKRSKLVFAGMWELASNLNLSETHVKFIEDTLLSILPLVKYKDYRSKSQDLHIPKIKLKEANIINQFILKSKKRLESLYEYRLNGASATLSCKDFRDFFDQIEDQSLDLIITDPPWNDGNAYFEKAQLYHPWLGYNLSADEDRLSREVVVTDAPSRPNKRDSDQWWSDIENFLNKAHKALQEHSYLVLFFRPVPARDWIENLNKIKFLARLQGFEPLLAVDIKNDDPSMRIQQSSHYAFSSDLVMFFLNLGEDERRFYESNEDIDELGFIASISAQEQVGGPFTRAVWQRAFFDLCRDRGALSMHTPRRREIVDIVFSRICEELGAGVFLPKPTTPYSDEIFNIPYIERVSLYVPYVIRELLEANDKFTFDQYLMKIAEFVENGTRSIIDDILNDGQNSLTSLLEMYASPIEGGRFFVAREIPEMPTHIASILELDPYEFEAFCANLLTREGFTNAVLCGRSGDRGVDIRCHDSDGHLVYVQCKRYTSSNISATPIQRLHSLAVSRGASRMICITTTDFTPDAIDEARIVGAELINREQLDEMVERNNIF